MVEVGISAEVKKIKDTGGEAFSRERKLS